MARITGTIPFADVQNLTSRAREERLTEVHRDLVEKNGMGLLHSTTEQNGDISWHFDYAEGFEHAPLHSHLTGHPNGPDEGKNILLTPEQVQAIHHARVILTTNARAKVDEDGKYVPLVTDEEDDDFDPGAANLCRDINVLVDMLAPYDTQGKQ